MQLAACLSLVLALPIGADPTVPVGAARVDITPAFPVRLSGYESRTAEHEGVAQPIRATALAFGEGAGAAVLVSVETCGVPAWITAAVAERVGREAGLARERIAIVATHTHTAPMLRGNLDNMFGTDIPPDQLERIDAYTAAAVEALGDVALAALAARAPGRLAWGRGRAGFAANRRTAGGPVDQDVDVLAAFGADGALRAVVAGYACHCTTLGGEFNRVHGDWAGCAREAVERELPGALCLVSIGCGADANPTPRGSVELAERNGAELAAEIARVAHGPLIPLPARVEADLELLSLPFDGPRTREEWEQRAAQGGAVGYHARKSLARLDSGEPLPAHQELPVQTWRFGAELAMVFLGGEVVVDYALRLKRELDRDRVWVTAYANDVPCYVPSERVLREGGYEAEGAMVYYDRPHRFASGLEDLIVAAVAAQVGEEFRPRHGIDPARTGGIAPRSPRHALQAFRTHSALEVELVAAERLVLDPVAIDWDREGRLFVVEMGDYPEGIDGAYAPGGRVVVLTDAGGDGLPDERAVFLDGLPFPTGVTTFRDGALVCAAPDVLFARDGDGDGRAEDVRVLYTGFATGNYQARVNSLSFGLDGWIHGASGLYGGTVSDPDGVHGAALGGSDFRFHPATFEIERAAGITQQGLARDDFGRWFGCDNSNLVRHYPLRDEVLRRNPHVAAPPVAVLCEAADDPGRLFPTSPVLARFNDPSHASRVTSACGLAIYRDTLLGEEYAGDVFVCEPVHNLVTRRELVPDGATFRAVRAESEREREFLSSDDPWFRPVQARTGPDGSLYVVDMARFVIEHPRWIPEERAAALDLRAGETLGRIWRVRRRGVALREVPSAPESQPGELSQGLLSPNGTVRELALAELLDVRSVDIHIRAARVLGALAIGNPYPAVRADALAALPARGWLGEKEILLSLSAGDPRVREVAAALLPDRIAASPQVRGALLARLEDPFARVRMEAAAALGACRGDAEVGAALGRLLARESDPYVRAAALSSAIAALPACAASAVAAGADDEAIEALASTAAHMGDGAALAALLASGELGHAAAVLDAIDRAGSAPPGELDLAPLLARARAAAVDPELPTSERVAALRALGRGADREPELEIAAAALAPWEPAELQEEALRLLGRAGGERAPELVLAALDALTPRVLRAALDLLLSRDAWAARLVALLEEFPARAAGVDPARRAALCAHPDAAVAARARALFGQAADEDRAAVVERYRPAADLAGDAVRGEAVFARVCATCHALGGAGKAVGPDLAALSDLSDEALLVAIFDPGRDVLESYLSYSLRTTGGDSLRGILRAESGASVTLTDADGADHAVPRSEIDELVGTGLSLMPAGLESELVPQDLADLLAHLRAAEEAPKRFPGNAPELVRPDAGGTIRLTAARGELRGPSILFEEPFQNAGYWSSADDRVTWTVELPAGGEYEVTLAWACPDEQAGGAWRLDGGEEALRGTVESTGAWSEYRTRSVGRMRVGAGRTRLTLRAEGPVRGALLDLAGLTFVPRGGP